MKIGILGGTGKEGSGLARRWAASGLEILIGSRDVARAEKAAAGLNSIPHTCPVVGLENMRAAREADLVVVSVPAEGHRKTLASLADQLQGKIVVDLVVPLDPKDFKKYLPPAEGSAAEEAQAILGKEAFVVAALHHVSFHLLNGSDPIETDVMVCGDVEQAKRETIRLIRLLGMRGIDCGPLTNAGVVEALTPVLLGINRRYRVKASGIRITGIDVKD